MNSPTESAPKAAALRQTGPLQQRSLSLPLSRLVLNPQDFNSEASEVVQNCDATLPLGLGYYAFDEAIAIPRALSVWAPRATPAPLVPTQALPPSGWASGEGAVVETVDGALRVSLARGGDSYIGTAVTSVVLDADKPVLRIAVRSVSGQWALHLGATSEVMRRMATRRFSRFGACVFTFRYSSP